MMTRGVIESLEVAETLYMSGARATFTVKPGAVVERTKLRKALQAKGLKLVRFFGERRPRPEASYVATVTGLG